MEARSFAWDLASAGGGADVTRQATSTVTRDASTDASNASARTVAVQQNGVQSGQVKQADVADIAMTEESYDTDLTAASAQSSDTENGTSNGSDVQSNGSNGNATTKASGSTDPEGESTGRTAAVSGEQQASETSTSGTIAAVGIASTTKSENNSSGTSGSAESGATDIAPLVPSEMNAFILENQKAELEQALAVERNKTRKDSLQTSLTAVEERIRLSETAASIAEQAPSKAESDTYGVDMTRLPITFYPASKDEDIITMLHADYASDKVRLEAIEDPVLRAEALNGLELMLADSLRGEMVRQATVLELSPEQGDVVLPKMERLRVMRQSHIKLAQEYQRESEAPLATRTEPLDVERVRATPRTAVQYPVGQDPIADRFVAVEPDAQNVYASKLEHRSPNVDDAIAFKDADLARMDQLTIDIDSIEMGMVDLPRKEYDKQRREADKLIDERMIIRSDLGQRSAYLSKEEWRTATDSMKVLDKQLATMGLAPDENLLLMAKNMRAEATSLFDQAAGMRKRADRSDDILVRDSLFRNAYAVELNALKEMDRSLTVKNYLIGSDFKRGETLAYEEVASKVLGIGSPLYVEEEDAGRNLTDPSVAHTGSISNGTTTAAGGTEEGGARTIAVSAGVPSRTDPEPLTAERTGSNGGVTQTSVIDGTSEPTSTGGTEVAIPSTASPAATERARSEAIDDVERASAQVPAIALAPVARYESFMTSENVILKPEALDPANDPELLSIQAKAAGRTSAEMEQRSLELADRATALEDSAATARKRDREELTVLAVRTRSTSDSLHTASLLKSEEARSLELQRRDAEEAKVLRDRLVKYYYLSPEEQAMVVENGDQSRYFQAKARALEQYDMAQEAEEVAGINRELAGALRTQVTSTQADVAAGRITRAQGEARNEVLMARTDLFEARADSLSNVAARLRGAAGINEGQATVMLQSVPEDRSTEWMALEMRARRTEALPGRGP